MQKSLCFALALCLTLNGCGVFRRSETWALVRGVRVDTRGETDPSQAYAAELSARLAAANVEHKVVTYQFRYRTYLREEAITTRTAVVYRDDTRPSHPWWVMEERLYQPVWLPNDDLGGQISFYLRDYAEVVETRDLPGTGGGANKVMLAGRRVARPLFSARATAATERRPPGERRRDRQSPLLVPFRTSSARTAQLRNAPVPAEVEKSATRTRSVPARRADQVESDAETILAKERELVVSSMFRRIHGTVFDPVSPVDRRKMRQLRQGNATRGLKTARAF